MWTENDCGTLLLDLVLSPPVECTNGYEETTGKSSHSCNDRRETECFNWKGTDESNKQSYPGLIQTNVDNKDLKIHQKVV